MKKRKIINIVIVAILIIESISLIIFIFTKNNTQLSKTIQSSGEKMTDTSRITELENQIDGLNAEHTTYGQYIQTNKTKIATAIANGGVSTSADASADTMVTNIATLAKNKYNLGVTDGRKGYYTAAQYNANYTNGYNAGVSSVNTNYSFNTVLYELVSNSTSSTNIRSGTYTAPAKGLLSYTVSSCNAQGSYVVAQLNGTTINSQYNPINLISGCINVNKGDVLYLYAYGYKGSTSNASAYIISQFAYK